MDKNEKLGKSRRKRMINNSIRQYIDKAGGTREFLYRISSNLAQSRSARRQEDATKTCEEASTNTVIQNYNEVAVNTSKPCCSMHAQSHQTPQTSVHVQTSNVEIINSGHLSPSAMSSTSSSSSLISNENVHFVVLNRLLTPNVRNEGNTRTQEIVMAGGDGHHNNLHFVPIESHFEFENNDSTGEEADADEE